MGRQDKSGVGDAISQVLPVKSSNSGGRMRRLKPPDKE